MPDLRQGVRAIVVFSIILAVVLAVGAAPALASSEEYLDPLSSGNESAVSSNVTVPSPLLPVNESAGNSTVSDPSLLPVNAAALLPPAVPDGDGGADDPVYSGSYQVEGPATFGTFVEGINVCPVCFRVLAVDPAATEMVVLVRDADTGYQGHMAANGTSLPMPLQVLDDGEYREITPEGVEVVLLLIRDGDDISVDPLTLVQEVADPQATQAGTYAISLSVTATFR
jgi:hypothetical protein